MPTSRSRTAICWLTADCERWSDSAAAENEPRAIDLPQHPQPPHIEHKTKLIRLEKESMLR